MRKSVRVLGAGLLLSALYGCGGGGTETARVSPAEVAGIYQVCALTFDPEGTLLRTIDIRQAFELENPEVARPQLRLNPTQEMQLVYTPRGEFVERRLQGTFTITGDRVRLVFTAGNAVPAAILLPNQLDLTYQSSPKSLRATPSATYEVRREDYARLAGESPSGLAERIPGQLTAVFQSGGCG